jgi:hypothetical protein
MGAHIIDGEFQSDKYPTCPAGKVPLSTKDTTAQDLLFIYAQRRRAVDAEFAADLETALKLKGFEPGDGFVVVKQEDLDWMLGTILNTNEILIEERAFADNGLCAEVNDRVFELANDYGFDLEEDEGTGTGS